MLFFFLFLSERWKVIPACHISGMKEIFNSLYFESHQSERLHICNGIFKNGMSHFFFNKNLRHLRMWNNRYGAEKGVLQLIPEVAVQRIKVRGLELPILFKIL